MAGLEYLLLSIRVCLGGEKGLKVRSAEIGLFLGSKGGELSFGSILSRIEKAS